VNSEIVIYIYIYRCRYIYIDRYILQCWGFKWRLRVLALARQVLYHLTHTPSHFCVDYFGDRVLLCASDSLCHSPPICAFPHSWIGRHKPSCLAIGWDGGLLNFLPELALSHDSSNLHLLIY
jgi:hypothetical protein